jgi:hypothetical protein
MTYSVVEVRLALLWRHCDRSWVRLARRLRRAPGAGGKLTALRDLRARLASAGIHDPLRPLPCAPALADVEGALRWLGEPPAPPPFAALPPDAEMVGLSTDALVDDVARSRPRMPRRQMEELLRRGPAVLPSLLALVRGEDGRGAVANLWGIVLLGELGHPAAGEVLGTLAAGDDQVAATTAAEALGRIGAPALAVLVALTGHAEPASRLRAYGALGMIPTDGAHHYLLAALARDPALTDVITAALVQHRRRDASDPYPDWRLRYRHLPRLGWRFAPTPLAIAALAHRRPPHDRRLSVVPRPRSLAGVLTGVHRQASATHCLSCGGRLWHPTGLPLCAHTARRVIALQCTVVTRWLAVGLTDPWTALDQCDEADSRLAQASTSDILARDLIAVERATLYWIVRLQRAEPNTDIRTGSAHLRLLARDLARLYHMGARHADRIADCKLHAFQNFS